MLMQQQAQKTKILLRPLHWQDCSIAISQQDLRKHYSCSVVQTAETRAEIEEERIELQLLLINVPRYV